MAMMALLRLQSKPSKGAESAVFRCDILSMDRSFPALRVIPTRLFAGRSCAHNRIRTRIGGRRFLATQNLQRRAMSLGRAKSLRRVRSTPRAKHGIAPG